MYSRMRISLRTYTSSGIKYEYYDRYTNVVKKVTADELLKLANTYLDFDQFYKVIVGKY
jgi:zinc protease